MAGIAEGYTIIGVVSCGPVVFAPKMAGLKIVG